MAAEFFADDAPDMRDATRAFFARCELEYPNVSLHVSQLVLDELAATAGQKAKDLAGLLSR